MVYSILYVDDEPNLLGLGKIFLELSGEFVVETRLSAVESLELLKTRSFDAIISDYQMPDMDGIRFLIEVRAVYGDLPFILFTGRGREEVVIEAINNGVDFYLQKGGHQKALFSELAHKIKKAVERRQAEHTINALINAPPDVSMLLDTNGIILELNKAATFRFQKSREELVGTDGYSLLFHDQAATPRDKILEMVASQEPCTTTDAHTGTSYETHLYPVTGHDGEITAVAVYSRDVTEEQKSRDELETAYKMQSVNEEVLRGQYESLKQGEEKIRESEEKYRLVVENSNDTIYIYRNSRFLFINQQATALTGYTHEELMSMDLWELIHPDDRGRLQESAARRISGDKIPSGFHAKILLKDGTTRYGEFFVDRVIFQGEPAILGIARDVTEKRRIIEALQESERTLRSLSDNLPTGMVFQIYTGPDGKRRFLHVSAGVERINGISAEAVLHDPMALFGQISPEDRLLLIDAERRALETMSPLLFRTRIQTPAGEERWVLLRSAPRDHPGGGIIWDGIELDITASHRAEEELKAAYEQLSASDEALKSQFYELVQSKEQLAESEEKYRAFVEHTGDGVFIAQDGLLVFTNGVVPALTGYTAEEITGLPFALLVAPEDREMVLSRHRNRLSGKSPVETYEFNLLHKDGITRKHVRIRVGAGNYRGAPAAIGTLHDVTEELRRDAALAESEEKFRSIVETSPDMIYDIDPKGKFRYISPNVREIMGYSPEEVIGKSILDLVTDQVRPALQKELERYSSLKGYLSPVDVHARHRDGHEMILEIRPSQTGTDDRRGGFRGVAIDITGRKQIEKALRESEELHRKMVAASPDVIVRVDLDGNIVYINERGVMLSGAGSLPELTGKPMFSFFAPESLPAALENTKLMFERPLGPREYIFITKHGLRVPLEVNGDVLRSPEGTPYGMIFICRDITDRKKTELALRESEEKYRNIIENIQDVFYRINREGVITMISPYGARLVGYNSPADIIGKVHAIEFYADPGERDAFMEYLVREKVVTGYPLTLKDRAGNLHFATASSRLLFDDAGEPDGIEGILHDVTPLRQTERALRQVNRQITLMTSITRHDIMNQLMVLKGYQELSRDFIEDREQVLDLIEKEQHVTRTIEEQIRFTTFFDDMGIKDPSWQDPAALVRKARESLPFRDIRLEMDLPSLEIFADPLFEKVFYNLLDNALRYGGGAMTTIRVHAKETDNSLSLVVEDNGIGIPANDKKRMFTRGYGKNTGLGLFLVREILSITGITIQENGVTGAGARFEMTVPKESYRLNSE
jgi:PAS domain S-box-containing protein